MTVLGPEVDNVTTPPSSQVEVSVDTPTPPPVIIQSTPSVTTVEPPSETRTFAQTSNTQQAPESEERKKKKYTSPKWVTILGYLLFAVIILANCYVIVELGLGNN